MGYLRDIRKVPWRNRIERTSTAPNARMMTETGVIRRRRWTLHGTNRRCLASWIGRLRPLLRVLLHAPAAPIPSCPAVRGAADLPRASRAGLEARGPGIACTYSFIRLKSIWPVLDMHYMSIFRRGVARSRGTPRRRGAFRALLKILGVNSSYLTANIPYSSPQFQNILLERQFDRKKNTNLIKGLLFISSIHACMYDSCMDA